MGIALIPTVITDFSGDFVPNCSVSNLFDITINGAIVFKPPVNLPDGGIFAIVIKPDINADWMVSWDDCYLGDAREPDQLFSNGYYGVNVYLYTNSLCILLNSNSQKVLKYF